MRRSLSPIPSCRCRLCRSHRPKGANQPKPVEPPPFDETGRPAGGPANRRAELYVNLRNALEGRFSLPDSTTLQGDLTSIGYRFTSEGKLLLEAKEDMRRRGRPSPDEGDAVAL